MMEWLSWAYGEYENQVEVMLRLCAATLSGMVIGLNRDIHNKPIGMRTLGLVSLGSATIVLSGSIFPDAGLHYSQDAVSRIIQGILTGLGFLGAGAILRGENLQQIQGLTTAATVWVAATLGVTAGLGAWFLTITGSLLTLALLVLGKPLEYRLTRFFTRGEDRKKEED